MKGIEHRSPARRQAQIETSNGFCEHGDEHWGSIKGGEFID
jgi:hypothetical protein